MRLQIFGLLVLIMQNGSSIPVDILAEHFSTGDHSLSKALLRVKKDSDGIGYLEECAFVDSWQEEPGFINVLAFLDASWEYSHRQANMLKMLQGRLERSRINGVKFFVINSAEPEATVNRIDIEDEKEAWSAAEPSLIDNKTFSEIEQTREALRDKIGPDITFVQDNETLKIWEKLSASRDQVIVIDRCGRLSYRVIVPWSILHFPYVKAAILSTYKEQPCGGCSVSPNEDLLRERINLETTTVNETTESQTDLLTESDLLPEYLNIKQMEKIAVETYNLDKTDNTVKKPYHGAESHDIPENVIQLLNGSAGIKHEEQSNPDSHNNNDMKHPPLTSSGNDSNFEDSYSNRDSNATNLMDGDNERGNPVVVEEIIFNVNESSEAQNNSDSSSPTIEASADSSESNTVQNIEAESFNKSERTDYLDKNDHVDNESQTTDSDVLRNVSTLDYGEKVNPERYLDATESGKVNNNTFDDEVLNNSSMSLSSSEEIDNHINKRKLEYDETDETHDNSDSNDYVMPIRIIMRAPHVHKDDDEEATKKYEYLELKFGDPEYHGHLDDKNFGLNHDEDNFENYRDDVNENGDVASEENGEIHGSGNDKDAKKKHRHHHGHKNGRKHSRGKHLDLVYDKDESPGFYGEDSEYWRNFGNVEEQENLQIERPEKNDEKVEEKIGFWNITEENDNDFHTPMIEEIENATITDDGSIVSRHQNSETNIEYSEVIEGKKSPLDQQEVNKNLTREEETANHLFVHYSKLIPWLDYVIDE